MTKEANKKTEECCPCCGTKEEVIDDMKKIGNKVIDLAKTAKEKYDKADDKTKKKILAGIAGAAAILAGVIGYNKMKKK